MESEAVAKRTARMWAKIGRALEARAYERAESGNLVDCKVAAQIGEIADACFWQSTGDAEGYFLKEVLK